MRLKSSGKMVCAVNLRKKGYSLRKISNELGVPKSTLSGWLKNVVLTEIQKKSLLKKWRLSLIKARKRAAEWHRLEKIKRVDNIKKLAVEFVDKINLHDKNITKLAIAILYLGEGTKNERTAMTNSDPLILKSFVEGLVNCFSVERNEIKCTLHLRADQNLKEIKKFWSKSLRVPIKNFIYTYVDKRTNTTKTYFHYKGVCTVRYGNIEIQRELLNISREFCNRIINNTRL